MKKILFPLCLAALAALLVVGVAYAAFFSIDPTDGTVDPGWNQQGGPTVTDPSGDCGGPLCVVANDIIAGWFSTNAPTPNVYQFRIDGAPLPVGLFGNMSSYLDCNNDGTFTDSEDIVTIFDIAVPLPDMVFAYDGTGAPLNGGGPVGSGETILTQVEWAVDATLLPPCPGDGNGHISVMFEVDFSPSAYDITEPGGFDLPTAIELQVFDTKSNSSSNILMGVALLMLLVVVGGFLMRKYSRRA